MPDSNQRPGLSIVVPCFNEEEVFPHLRKALEELLLKFADLNPEVLLIDDGPSRSLSFICAGSAQRN